MCCGCSNGAAASRSWQFVPGEGATQDMIRTHHARLVEATTKDVFDRVSRKALFS